MYVFSTHTHRLQSSLSTSDGKYVCLRCLSRLFVEPRELSILGSAEQRSCCGRQGRHSRHCLLLPDFLSLHRDIFERGCSDLTLHANGFGCAVKSLRATLLNGHNEKADEPPFCTVRERT